MIKNSDWHKYFADRSLKRWWFLVWYISIFLAFVGLPLLIFLLIIVSPLLLLGDVLLPIFGYSMGFELCGAILLFAWTISMVSFGLTEGRKYGNEEQRERDDIDIKKTEKSCYLIGYRDAMEGVAPKFSDFKDSRLKFSPLGVCEEVANIRIHPEDVEALKEVLMKAKYRPKHKFNLDDEV